MIFRIAQNILVATFVLLASTLSVAAQNQTPPAAVAATSPAGTGSTADHTKFDILDKEFTSGPEVTAACLTCHTEADNQVMHSIHYQWEFENTATGQILGKSNVINSFCGNVAGNEARCTSCHAGYGWDDISSPPPAQSNAVDCLACHDRSGQYTKTSTGAGHPPLDPVPEGTRTITGALAWAVDLNKAAQSVGMPGRENCGQCHFYGGGGDNVKHGDLSSALYNPTEEVDVHMATDGLNFTCSTCHVTDQHEWAGSRYDVTASDPDGIGKPGERRDVATCESCHANDPHPATSVIGLKLNDHVDKVACQTCHIPEFARGGVATKTLWDWSTAGRLEDGKIIKEHEFTQSDGAELHTYLSTKGDFEWGEDVVPFYSWFNGQIEYTTGDQTIDPGKVVEVNSIGGAAGEDGARIWPFKLMEGRQAYDSELNRLAYSHVWGPDTDTAFWSNFDWDKAIEAGMEAAGAEYSGNFGFVDTHMYWPITHMVAPAADALKCQDCHAEGGRLDDLEGFYLPGRQPFSLVGLLGIAMVLATIAGVLGHALIRKFTNKNGSISHE